MATKTLTKWAVFTSLVGCVVTGPGAFAGDLNLGSRVPTAQELIDHLRPAKAPVRKVKTRGIRLTPAASQPQPVAYQAEPASQPAPQVAAKEPAQPPAQPAAQQEVAVSMEVLFGFDSFQLTPQAQQILHPLGQALQSPQLAGLQFVIEGHTDAQGSDGYNLNLSKNRAAAVRNHLHSYYGVDVSILQSVGRGESDLLDTSNPYSAVNRRVRIVSQTL